MAKNTATLKALPVRVWHDLQWQADTFKGSPIVAMDNAPHEQLAILSKWGLLVATLRDAAINRDRAAANDCNWI
jgi:hypothetical protein